MSVAARKGIRAAQLGILVNSALAVTKLVAGVAGNSYALVADAIESATDIVSSLILMSGLWISQREPTEDYPFGFGRAETLAATTMALMLIGAVGIGIQAVREILTPHHLPETWTLGILVGVIAIKRDRRGPRGLPPPTPPDVRVRIRRFRLVATWHATGR